MTLQAVEHPNSLRESVADAGRVLAAAGQGDLIWGHVSVRDPDGRGVWIKRRGIGLDETTAEDVQLVDEHGDVVTGAGHPHAEVHLHTQIMKARPDIHAVVHTHAQGPVVLVAAGREIRPLSHEGTYFAPHGVPVFRDTGRMITGPELGRRLADTLGKASGLVLRNHGTVTVGVDVAHAGMASLLLERAADAQLRVLSGPSHVAASSPREAEAKRAECYSPRQIAMAWSYLRRSAFSAGAVHVD
jgi:L-ribulose-5-phosphate 4-epimerase